MPSEAVLLVQQVYEAFRTRDVPTVLRLLSPDMEIVQSEELPWGGRYHGHAGVQEFFGKLLANITSTVTVERFIDSGSHVTVIGWTRGHVNATGAEFDVAIAHVWRVNGGVATHVHFLIDNPVMLQALS